MHISADPYDSHTVEELQQFSNTRTPSAPWMFVKRLLVPMSCCDEAATYVIDVLGGEQKTRELVGGTKWWQVRGLKGYVIRVSESRSCLTTLSVWTHSGLLPGKITSYKGGEERNESRLGSRGKIRPKRMVTSLSLIQSWLISSVSYSYTAVSHCSLHLTLALILSQVATTLEV